MRIDAAHLLQSFNDDTLLPRFPIGRNPGHVTVTYRGRNRESVSKELLYAPLENRENQISAANVLSRKFGTNRNGD